MNWSGHVQTECRPIKNFAIVTLLSLGLAGCGGALSGNDYFDDGTGEDDAPDVAVIKSLMTGLGGVDSSKNKGLKYDPRSPLVIPPTRELPPTEQEIATNSAGDWPNDPDVAEAKLRDEWAKREETSIYSKLKTTNNDRSTPEEIARQRIPGGGISGTTAAPTAGNDVMEARNNVMTPDQLRTQRVETPDAVAMDENGIPVRRYLVEPPSDYRLPSSDAPMVDAPSYIEDEARKKKKPMSREEMIQRRL